MKAEIVTYTGKLFDIFNPKPDLVCIEDIAHSLANQCRYTGHTKVFYSVAQHSVQMATSAELKGDPLVRLLHDAAEAYFGDIASPLKRAVWVPDGQTFRSIYAIESNLVEAIGSALSLNLEITPEIKLADRRMLVTEVRDLMPDHSVWESYRGEYKPLKEKIVPWSPKMAEVLFLKAYRYLTEKRSR